MGRLLLITGGARSGKSGYAERLVADLGARIAYLATAAAVDAEMEERITRHQVRRPPSWQTFETPVAPSRVIDAEGERFDAMLLDCLTVMIGNRMLGPELNWNHPEISALNALEEEIMAEIEALIRAADATGTSLLIVSNEVGCGVVPPSAMGRFFRDCAGRANQRLAEAADGVVLVAAGIPLWIKGG